MRFKALMLFMVFMLCGCTFSDDDNEITKLNQQLEIEIQSLNEELNNLKEIEPEIVIEQANLSEEQTKLIEFMKSYDLDSEKGLSDSTVQIKAFLKEPLRCLPSDESPYIIKGKLTYESEGYISDVEIEGGLLYTLLDSNGNGWSLIVVDDDIGYVHNENIWNYNNISDSYETNEKFSGLSLGMTVDDLEEIYSGEIDYIEPKQRDNRIANIYRNGDYYVDCFYDKDTNVIDFIRVKTSDIPLESGYKVGDDSEQVFEYYDSKYTQLDIGIDFYDEYRIYYIGDGYRLEVSAINGVVDTIILTPGYNIYM